MTCPDAATDLGAYVLGALDPADRRRVEEHLSGCPACEEEFAELEALPGLLDRVHPADLVPVVVAPSPELFARMAAAAAPRARFRARTWALVAAAVLVAVGIGAGVTGWLTAGVEQTVTASAGAMQATVTVTTVNHGSALVVTVAGMRPEESCTLVAVGRDGTRHPAGTWPVPASGAGTWRGWADIDRADLAAVILVGDGGRELVRALF